MLGHLFQTSLFAAVAAAVVGAILLLFRRASPRWRLALWSLVLVRLLIPANWWQPLSARAALEELQRLLAGPTPAVYGAEPDFAVPGTKAGPPVAASRQGFMNLQVWLLSGWLAGSAFFMGLYLARLGRYRRIARRAAPVTDPAALELAEHWRTRFAVRRPVRLVSGGGTPFTLGLRRPLIVLPPRLLEPGRKRVLEPVIAHEMAHIRRLDALWLPGQNLLQALYFFHPAVWFAGGRIHAARECVCDGMVLARGDIPKAQYGRGLLVVLRDRSPDLYGAVSGMSPSARQWKTRLKNLQGEHDMRKSRTLAPLFGTLVFALLLLPMAARPHDDPPSVSAPAPVPDVNPAPATASDEPAATSSSKPILKVPLSQRWYLTSTFGWRINPITKKKDHHDGIDLAAEVGKEVLASGDGTVAEVTTDKSAQRGMTVTIDHGHGWQTFYAFLEELSVAPGQAVKQGDPIGKIGKVGVSTGPHLHFQVMKDGKPIDPKDVLSD